MAGPIRFSISLGLAGLIFPAVLFAQAPSVAGPKLPKQTDLEKRIETLSTAKDASDDTLKAIADYREAQNFLRDAAAAEKQAEDFLAKAASGPADLEKLTTLPAEPAVEPLPQSAGLDEANTRLEAAKAALAEARAATKVSAAEAKSRAARQAALPGMIAEANANLTGLDLPEAPLATAPDQDLAAYQRALAQRRLLSAQVKSMEAELAWLEATPALFAARSGVLSQKSALLGTQVDALQLRVDELRVAAASDEVAKARANVERYGSDPVAGEIAAAILDLAERHGGKDGLSVRMAAAAAELSSFETRADRISKQFSSAKRRVKLLEEVGLRIDAATGQLLRSQRQILPPEGFLRDRLRDTVQISAQAQIDLLALDDRFSELLAARAPATPPQLAQLWKDRLAGLRRLIEDHRSYIKQLRSMTTEIRGLLGVSVDFARFVDERLLWIPSVRPIGADELTIEKNAILALAAADPLAPLFEDALENYWLWGLFGLFWIYLVVRRRAFRAKLAEMGEAASRRNCTTFVPTGLALLHSVLLAAPVPLVFLFLYSRSAGCPPAFVSGLRSVSGFFTVLIFLRVVTQPHGLLIAHFRMSEERVKVLRRNLSWFVPTMPPFLFLATSLPLDAGATSAGRLSFMVVVAIFLVFFARLLRPREKMIHWQGHPANRFAKAWYFLGIGIPLALIAGAAIGYYASVQELRIQALLSVGLILATLFVAALLHRWILVSRRRLAVQQALKRRAAALSERDAKEAEPGEKPQNVASLEEVKANAVKVVEVEEQTTRLVRAAAIAAIAFGLLGIWRTAVPALSAFDRVTLWTEKSTPATAPEAAAPGVIPLPPAAAAEGAKSTETVPADEDAVPDDGRVTLQDLSLAFVILFLTVVAARNIPGLLELAVFRHLHLPPGSSFAFTTSFRYLIVVIGVVMSFAKIGIDWGKVQWIAAAITLGIGFGLQEIFANFVAGLIILFERPIRLGDVVTIAGVDGRVTQIRIRATTIRQFNSRELIVPNKEFITGQLVNWTLSDNILRVEVPVGIAYGSDTELARELLLRAAEENPRILDEPAPIAVFENFADSSLAFTLRAHVGSVDDLLPAKSELHFAVDKAFRAAGIEIAFPQSDIHIRSLPGGAEFPSPLEPEPRPTDA